MYGLVGPDDHGLENIFRESLPGTFASIDYPGWNSLINNSLLALTDVDSRSPGSILGYELNLGFWSRAALSSLAYAAPVEEEGGEEDYYLPEADSSPEESIEIPPEEFPPVQLNGEPMILIYTTHNAESYKPSDGVSRLEGKNGGVALVSKQLTQTMESKHSIKTIYSDVIHDFPDFTKSYINSMRTVQQLLKVNPRLQVLLDIHRDAGQKNRSDTLVKIGGKDCAKIMIVVGTEHPNWKQNLAFAEKIAAKADQMHPGLLKNVLVRKDRRYNQHLHPRALLLEFGSELNTREDVKNSAVLFADVLAAVLKSR